MKAGGVVAAASGGVALLAALMPLATNGLLTASVSHLGGITIALYILPVPLIVAAALALHETVGNPRWWYLAIGGSGLGLSLLSASAAVGHLEMFGSAFGGLSAELLGAATGQAASAPGWAFGAYALVAAYAATIGAGLLPTRQRAPAASGI
jgi:hypothetical protein